MYCLQLWGKTCVNYVDKLVKIQKKLARIITLSKCNASTDNISRCNKILKIKQIYEYMFGLFMFKSTNNELPRIFRDMCVLNTSVHSYSTGQYGNYNAPSVRQMLSNIQYV